MNKTLKDLFEFLKENNIQLEDDLILTLEFTGPNGKRIYSSLKLDEKCCSFDIISMLVEQVFSTLNYVIKENY